MTPEGRVKQQIKAYLRSIGAYQFWPVQMGFGSPTVDCLACINGKFYGIEVKRPGHANMATPRQEATIHAIRYAKGEAFVTDDLAYVVKIVEGLQ